MKLLLDECIDRRLAPLLSGHVVRTVPQEGWAGVKNGQLLQLASAAFDVFITVDRNLAFEHPVSQLHLAVMVLQSPSNRVEDLRTLVPAILSALDTPKTGDLVWVP